MKQVLLNIDVYCTWNGYPPSYRLYVDNDLMTERTYIWDNKIEFVRENVLVNLGPGEHTIRLEKVREPGQLCDFKLVNFTVDKRPTELTKNQFTIAE